MTKREVSECFLSSFPKRDQKKIITENNFNASLTKKSLSLEHRNTLKRGTDGISTQRVGF